MNPPLPQETAPEAAAASEVAAPKSESHPLKTGLWMFGAVLMYYALQAWILPAAGIQT